MIAQASRTQCSTGCALLVVVHGIGNGGKHSGRIEMYGSYNRMATAGQSSCGSVGSALTGSAATMVTATRAIRMARRAFVMCSHRPHKEADPVPGPRPLNPIRRAGDEASNRPVGIQNPFDSAPAAQ
jgi:hypothetical protein